MTRADTEVPTRSAHKRLIWLASIAAALAALVVAAPAAASGDFGCSKAWKLKHPELTGCDSMVMLSPSNDTRVNLILLLGRSTSAPPPAPASPPPAPLFDWATFVRFAFPGPTEVGSASLAVGEGSRCRSNEAGSAAFIAAVGAARDLRGAEAAALIAARRDLKPDCAGPGGTAAMLSAADATMRSAAARAFMGYLHGTASFYAGDFNAATQRFVALGRAKDPWLRETARYMLARVEVNRAQIGAYDDYGYRDEKRPVDTAAVAAAESTLREYLRAYPQGRYAASARGLLRRVYWLGGETRKLAAAYAAIFAQPPEQRGLDDATLAEEVDNKLLPMLTAADTSDPILLAILDLRAMRQETGDAGRATLEAQRPSFTSAPALFDFLLAAHAFYVAEDPRAALRLVGDRPDARGIDTVSFSRQMLKGMAQDALGTAGERAHWLAMLPDALPLRRTVVELALALHDERTAGLERVFGAASPIRDARVRDILLANVAGPDLLRRQAGDKGATAHERATALFTLLYKGLTRGRYGEFVNDVAAVPPGAAKDGSYFDPEGGEDPPLGIFTEGPTMEAFPCPKLRETARRLAASASAATPRLCLAEFVRLNDLDGFALDTQPPDDELGGTRSHFPGRVFSRLDLYQSVIASSTSSSAERAYALFRAVRCYAPSRNNGCGGAGVPPEIRRAWFQRLHRDYPKSRWTGELEYYW
jgi:hypothetical protein